MQTQSVNTALVTRYTSPLDCIKRIYVEEGMMSFWRGNTANVLRYFPNQALSLAFKDHFKGWFIGNSNNGQKPQVISLMFQSLYLSTILRFGFIF